MVSNREGFLTAACLNDKLSSCSRSASIESNSPICISTPCAFLIHISSSTSYYTRTYKSIFIMSDVGLRKKRLETDAWERHRQVIEHLYLDQGQPLEQVMAFMKANHEFEATEQAYKKKLRRWKISKNIPAHAMECILLQMEARQEMGKDSAIFWHGRPVDAEKIERSKQRMKRERKENPEKQIAPLDQGECCQSREAIY